MVVLHGTKLWNQVLVLGICLHGLFIKPNTSTKVVTKLCRQPFKVSCLISYRSLGAAHSHIGVNLPFRGSLSFAASHQNVVPLKEIKEEARSFEEGQEWEEGGWFCLSVSLPLCFVAGKPRPFHAGSQTRSYTRFSS